MKAEEASGQASLAGSASTIAKLKANHAYQIPNYNYIDLAASYKLKAGVQFTLGVNNIADKEPPLGAGVSPNDYGPGEYDIALRSGESGKFKVAVWDWQTGPNQFARVDSEVLDIQFDYDMLLGFGLSKTEGFYFITDRKKDIIITGGNLAFADQPVGTSGVDVPREQLAVGVDVSAPDGRDQFGVTGAVDVRQRDTHTYSNARTALL